MRHQTASRDVTRVRVLNDDGAQIVRARVTAIAGLDHDGSILVGLS
jgi:hypothetical protein